MTVRELPGSACLMHGMADKLGVDPGVAVNSGVIGTGDLDAMIQRCKSCVRGDECVLWMLDHSTGAEAAPGYCLNSEELDQLRRHDMRAFDGPA